MYGIYDKGGVLSIFIDRHVIPSRTSNWFDLNYPKDGSLKYIFDKYIYSINQ